MLDLKLKREELLKGVSQTQSIAERRSSMPILSNVLLEVQEGRLAITATDLEISFRGSYQAEINQEGRLTIPARKFYEIVRVLDDEELSLKEAENFCLILTGKRSDIRLNGLSPEDFPPLPDYDNLSFVDISADLLLDMIEKTIYSIAVEETRYNLAGVYVEKDDKEGKNLLRMVSTDGHRLSLVEKEVTDLNLLELETGAIISRKGLTEARKMAEEGEPLKIGFTANSAVIKAENAVLVMRLLEGRFPDYNMVVPKKNDKIMKLGRKDFSDVLRRVSVMSSDDYRGVSFSLSPKELRLTAINPEVGKAEEGLLVDYEGESIQMGFNPRYFLEALSSLKSDTLNVAFREADHPCILTAPDDKGYLGVVMPMKL